MNNINEIEKADDIYGKSSDYGTEEIQHELLDLLILFHKECESNHLQYSLNSGTLLGAIRHNGFIPWDDDADVMMTRESFEKYVKLDHEKYGLRIVRHKWVTRVMKSDFSSEAFIDLFVVDHVPDNNAVQKIKVLLVRTLQGMMKGKVPLGNYRFPYNYMILATFFLGKTMSQERKYSLYQSVSKIGNKRETKNTGIYNNLYKSIPRVYDTNMMRYITTHTFENTRLYITEEYDNYLTAVYGDYMTPPGKEDRKKGNFQIRCNNSTFVINNAEH